MSLLNKITDELRRHNHTTRLNELTDSPTENITEHIDAAIDLEAVLKLLTPKQAEVMWMKEIEGLSIFEISTMLGISENSVKTRLLNAKQKIAKLKNNL